MKAEVMELVKELGFKIVSTSAVFGVKDARVHAENEVWTIRTQVTGSALAVEICKGVSETTEAANFCFRAGELPYLRFQGYTPELFEIARRFGAVAGFEI